MQVRVLFSKKYPSLFLSGIVEGGTHEEVCRRDKGIVSTVCMYDLWSYVLCFKVFSNLSIGWHYNCVIVHCSTYALRV